jgi:hypothetical protein
MATVEVGPAGKVATSVENYCPFGCCLADMDENGACRHLVGFTNDGKTYEPLVMGARGLRIVDAMRFDRRTGLYTRNIKNVQAEDRIVNPEYAQLDQGVIHMCKRFVSARVYREKVEEEEVPMLPGGRLGTVKKG